MKDYVVGNDAYVQRVLLRWHTRTKTDVRLSVSPNQTIWRPSEKPIRFIAKKGHVDENSDTEAAFLPSAINQGRRSDESGAYANESTRRCNIHAQRRF